MLYKDILTIIFYVFTLGSIGFVIAYLFVELQHEIRKLKYRIDYFEMQFELQLTKDRLNEINNKKD
jgi:hypothetical protein